MTFFVTLIVLGRTLSGGKDDVELTLFTTVIDRCLFPVFFLSLSLSLSLSLFPPPPPPSAHVDDVL